MDINYESLFDHPDISSTDQLPPFALESLDFDSFSNGVSETVPTTLNTTLVDACMNKPLLWQDSDIAEHTLKQSLHKRESPPQTIESTELEADWSFRLLRNDPQTALIDVNSSSWLVSDVVDRNPTSLRLATSTGQSTTHEHCQTCVCGSATRTQQQSETAQQPLSYSNSPFLDSFLQLNEEQSTSNAKVGSTGSVPHGSIQAGVCSSESLMSSSAIGIPANLTLEDLFGPQTTAVQEQSYETPSSDNSSSDMSAMSLCPSHTTSPSVRQNIVGNDLGDWLLDSTTFPASSSSSSSPATSGLVYASMGQSEVLPDQWLQTGWLSQMPLAGPQVIGSQWPTMPELPVPPIQVTQPMAFSNVDTALSLGQSCAAQSMTRKRSFDTMTGSGAPATTVDLPENAEAPQAKRVVPADYDIFTAKRETLIKEVVEPTRKGGLYGVPSKLINGWAYATKQWMYTDLHTDKVRGKKLFRKGFNQMHIDDLRELVRHCRNGLPWQSKVISLGHLTLEQKTYFNLH